MIAPWQFELYLHIKLNPNATIKDSYEKARIFIIDFERSLATLPDWYFFYLVTKTHGYTDACIAEQLEISTRTLQRRLNDYYTR